MLCPRLEWKQVLLWLNVLVFLGWATAQSASNSPLSDGLSIVYTWPSPADVVWMIKDRLQRFQRGKGSFTKAANMENVLHADALDHRLKIPYLITLPHHVKWSRHYQIKKHGPCTKRLKSDLTHMDCWKHMTIFQSRSQLHKHKMYSHTFLHTKRRLYSEKNMSLISVQWTFKTQDFRLGKSVFNNNNFWRNFR